MEALEPDITWLWLASPLLVYPAYTLLPMLYSSAVLSPIVLADDGHCIGCTRCGVTAVNVVLAIVLS